MKKATMEPSRFSITAPRETPFGGRGRRTRLKLPSGALGLKELFN